MGLLGFWKSTVHLALLSLFFFTFLFIFKAFFLSHVEAMEISHVLLSPTCPPPNTSVLQTRPASSLSLPTQEQLTPVILFLL